MKAQIERNIYEMNVKSLKIYTKFLEINKINIPIEKKMSVIINGQIPKKEIWSNV